MRLLHAFNSLIVLYLLDFVDLLDLVQDVLELLHKIARTHHNQLALACLADRCEFHLWLNLVGHLVFLEEIVALRFCRAVKCLVESLLGTSHHGAPQLLDLLIVVQSDHCLLIECLTRL